MFSKDFQIKFKRNLLLVSAVGFSLLIKASELKHDSLSNSRKLEEVVVSARHNAPTRQALPTQLYSCKEIERLNAMNVTDVVRFFSGVTVKDYGGIGGLKTVSLRGMCAQYTGVSYDGVMISNIQSGQVDLGRYSLENLSEISLTNAQPNDIFQSARLFSSGSVLSLKTRLLSYDSLKTYAGKVSFKAGSFGLINPSVFVAKNFGRKWSLNFSTDVLKADGKYPFTLYYGTTSNLSKELVRTNTDIEAIRTELNGVYRISNSQSLAAKVNYYASERGLPGSVVFYNPTISTQRLTDRDFFAQLHYTNRESDQFQQQFFAKYNSSFNFFTEADSKYPGGILKESYLQNEYYLSSAFLYKLNQSLLVTAAADWFYNTLDINFKDFNYPTRHTGLFNIAAKYETERISISANALYTLTHEAAQAGTPSPDRERLTPTVNFSYKLCEDKDLRIRAFYKNTFRLPTFNELYYQQVGNPNLRPEIVDQFNLGGTYLETSIPIFSEFSVMLDAYHNNVKDKIISIPKDMFHWSMTNRGNVLINGLDLSVKADIKTGNNRLVRFKANYGYQSATDQTAGSDNYGEQIPYTPFHSGSCSVSYQWNKWEAGYNLQYSGERWTGQMTVETNRLNPFAISNLFVNTSYKGYKVSAEVLNLFNNQYEVVKFYPMPGINFRLTASVEF